MPDTGNVQIDPITYRQVVINAQNIGAMFEALGIQTGDITNLKQWFEAVNAALGDLTDPDKPGIEPSVEGTGDVRGKLPELSVIGAHALTDKQSESLAPSAYQRLVTYEIKDCNIIGLDVMDDVTSTTCILQTWAPSAQEIADIPAFQIAYVNSGLAFSRLATNESTWGEWRTGNIGGGSGEMGVAMALCAVLEVPAMLCFGLLLKRKKVEFWVRMCSVFFALKAFLTLLTTSIPVFYAVQVLQPFGWGIMSVASVFYVNAIMEPGDAIKGQAYITMTLTLGTVLSAVAGGQLIDNLGVTAMLTFGTAVAILGAGINLFSTQKTD